MKLGVSLEVVIHFCQVPGRRLPRAACGSRMTGDHERHTDDAGSVDCKHCLRSEAYLAHSMERTLLDVSKDISIPAPVKRWKGRLPQNYQPLHRKRPR